MSNIGDEANAHMEFDLAQSLRASHKPVPRLSFIGICHNPDCGERVAAPKRFCDSDCTEAWEASRK